MAATSSPPQTALPIPRTRLIGREQELATARAGMSEAAIVTAGANGEVLRLLCQRLTASEIGEMLFMSRRTAEMHVGHVYAKLGVRSRRDAVALAVRHSLD